MKIYSTVENHPFFLVSYKFHATFISKKGLFRICLCPIFFYLEFDYYRGMHVLCIHLNSVNISLLLCCSILLIILFSS